MIRMQLCVLTTVLCLTSWSASSVPNDAVSVLRNKSFRYSEAKGIGLEPGITRRDPSDVIKVDGTYYVWYTHVVQSALLERDMPLRTTGYAAATIWYATSADEGHTWTEHGEALGHGKGNAFDSYSVFTPNIVKADGKYHLFYTGVKATPGRADGGFDNNSTTDVTALGLAVSVGPEGPFKRVSTEPIMTASRPSPNPGLVPSKFDSFRVDDAALLYRDNKYWLYYKGRNMDDGAGGPGHTCMGLAIAENIEGPYVRANHGEPILPNSHEVLIWPHGDGVAAYAAKSQTLEYAPDGMDFTSNPVSARATPKPIAPGAYRPDLTTPVRYGQGIQWGIAIQDPGGPAPYLVRFEIDLSTDH